MTQKGALLRSQRREGRAATARLESILIKGLSLGGISWKTADCGLAQCSLSEAGTFR